MKRPDSALLTDVYQLTMLQAYHRENMFEPAVFELFARSLPEQRNFYVAAGLEQCLDYLENFRFTEDECDWLADCGFFQPEFVAYLADLRFTGDVQALPEGTIFFPDEPILRVSAPLPEAQIIETRLINLCQFQSMIASKAARCVLAAPNKRLVDFGLRRAHGYEAGLLAARASYLAGFAGTSNVLAAHEFGIPMFGTMAHSFIMAHDDEALAFEHFAKSQPDNVTLLIDTYDTEAGAGKAVELAPRLKKFGARVQAVRLDSGDLVALSKSVRQILDQGGLPDTRIFASGDLDEFALERLLGAGAPIDGFGVGTKMVTSADHPYLNCAYKLQEYAGKPRRKYSPGKTTWPGPKQIFRNYDAEGKMDHDVLTLENDVQPGETLLRSVMASGKRVAPPEPLTNSRERVAEQLARLPEALQAIGASARYPVEIGAALNALAERMAREAF
ncbi:MAG: nicotinate phosphoribosyltransferase [Gammaproteobacteria bacterium]